MRTAAAILLLSAAPAAAAYHDTTCDLVLRACEMARDTDGTCPAGAPARAEVQSEGESWFLATKGVARGADGAAGDRAERFEIKVHQTEPVRTYFIVSRDGISGAFSQDPDGKGHLTVFVTGRTGSYEEYFDGSCEASQ